MKSIPDNPNEVAPPPRTTVHEPHSKFKSYRKLIWINPEDELPTNEEEFVLVRIKDESLCLEESPYQICKYRSKEDYDDPYSWPWVTDTGDGYKTKIIQKWAHIPD